MENLPPGWSRRRSGILVPKRRQRALLPVGAILLAALAFASPLASGVSTVARAVSDVAQAVRVLTDGE